MNASGVSMMSYTTIRSGYSSESSLPSPMLKVTDSSGKVAGVTKTAQGRWRSQTTAGETYAAELK